MGYPGDGGLGNASTATLATLALEADALSTPRAIHGEDFDGTADIDFADLNALVAEPVLLSAILGDASVSKAVADGSQFTIPVATLSANRTLTLSTTGAVAGDVIRVVRRDVSNKTLAVVNGGAGAGTLYTFPASNARIADFVFDGTNWLLSGHAALT